MLSGKTADRGLRAVPACWKVIPAALLLAFGIWLGVKTPAQARRAGTTPLQTPALEEKPSLAAPKVEPALASPFDLPPGTPLYPVTLVRTVDTSNAAWNPSSPDPSGIDYWPLTGRMLVVDSEVDEMPPYFTGVNVYDATATGTLVSTCSTTNLARTGWSNEPTGLAINPSNNHLYISDDFRNQVFEVSLGPDNTYCTADDVVTSATFQTDTEDVAYGANKLFIAGGIQARVYVYDLGANGVIGGGDDNLTSEFDTASLGFNDLEGIAYNPDRGTLFILSTQVNDKYLGEVTLSGQLLRAYDLSIMGAHSNIRSDVAYAPSSVNPSQKNIYIVSRGLDNDSNPTENDGKWREFSLGPVPGAFAKLSPPNGIDNQPLAVTLNWGAASGAVEYEYCIDTTNDNACSNWVSTGTATSKSLTSLTSGKTYYWQVRTLSGGGYSYADGSPSSFRSFSTITTLVPPWSGSAAITSNRPVVAVVRPHIGAEVASYDGFSAGGLTAYAPMLFKDAFGGSYDAALYIQNVNAANTANITIKFYDSTGTLNCTKTDTVPPLASRGYWIPSESCLPAGWVGGAVVTSDSNIVAVGRPHVGDQVMTYNGFTAGSTSAYLPMLFKNAFSGSYASAFYIQNMDAAHTANITIKFYDSAGTLSCILTDTVAALASKGWWVPAQSCLPAGWVGGAVITSDWPIVTLARPHIGAEVTAYSGLSVGNTTLYVPMLFKQAFGGSYDAAFYVQNLDSLSSASLTIKFYDSAGNLTCTLPDMVAGLASRGYWTPALSCLPAGWVGGAVVSSNRPIVAVGRPHVGAQITTYPALTSGSTGVFLPMLFKQALGGAYDSAFYLQNTDVANPASVTVNLYDTDGNLSCQRTDSIPAGATLGYWVPGIVCSP